MIPMAPAITAASPERRHPLEDGPKQQARVALVSDHWDDPADMETGFPCHRPTLHRTRSSTCTQSRNFKDKAAQTIQWKRASNAASEVLEYIERHHCIRTCGRSACGFISSGKAA